MSGQYASESEILEVEALTRSRPDRRRDVSVYTDEDMDWIRALGSLRAARANIEDAIRLHDKLGDEGRSPQERKRLQKRYARAVENARRRLDQFDADP